MVSDNGEFIAERIMPMVNLRVIIKLLVESYVEVVNIMTVYRYGRTSLHPVTSFTNCPDIHTATLIVYYPTGLNVTLCDRVGGLDVTLCDRVRGLVLTSKWWWWTHVT